MEVRPKLSSARISRSLDARASRGIGERSLGDPCAWRLDNRVANMQSTSNKACCADVLTELRHERLMREPTCQRTACSRCARPSVMFPVWRKDNPIWRCAFMSGALAFCALASAKNWTASSDPTSLLKATKFATQRP